ncbi:hormogonium polysaccharide biosynthesis glycosyltransferase HpsE [Baaleninema sp.]|uniref:hormogonium polysaccharide biosynthesis glycosyltransferase HpsE n=1 Tax=Baaleninema sp. TaxID=3101197 RepID=UPI003CFC335C
MSPPLSSSPSPDFTVAICTYNGETRLPEVLDALQQQEGTEDIAWEVLVVDNNSDDGTPDVVNQYRVNQYRETWPRLRYVRELKQGTAYARQRAIAEAQSPDLVGFLDDDNIPASDWVRQAYEFGCQHPKIGAYGGNIRAKLDIEPPEYFDRIKILLAVYDRGDKPFCYARDRKPRIVPAAPGSVVRKQAWRDCVPPRLLLQGRDEKNCTYIGACEDLETLFYIQNSSWQIWHNPQMTVFHHIPPHRLQRKYLLKIARTSGLSNHALRTARLFPKRRFLMFFLMPIYLLSDGLKAIVFWFKYRKEIQNNFEKDIPKACEFQSRIGRFLSPFFVRL